MSAREVIFLGTASQVPTRVRNHNALFLRWDDLGILFDPGEGTQRQMLHAGLSASQITHVCVTHFHGDHCLGLAGVIQRLSLDRVPHPVRVIYPASGQVYFERLRHATAFHEVATLIPTPVSVGDAESVEVCRAGKFRLLASALDHRMECHGYRLQEDDSRRMLPERLAAAGVAGPDVGRLQKTGAVVVGDRRVTLEEMSEPRRGQSFSLIMDTRACPGAETLAKGADLVVCESTYLHADRADAVDHYHLTSIDAAEIAAAAGARRLALTHYSQRYMDADAFRREAASVHGDVHAAEDLATVAVPER